MWAFKRNGAKNYTVKFMYNGKPVQFSTKQPNREVALKMGAAELTRLTQIDAGIETSIKPFRQKQEHVTVAELMDRLGAYFARNGQASAQNVSLIGIVKKELGHHDARSLTADQLNAYRDKLLADDYAVATVNRRTQMLFLAYHLSGIKPPVIEEFDESGNVRQGYYSEAELAAVLENLPPHYRDFVEWCSITGQRRGEVARLTWDMVVGVGDEQELHIPATICKNGFKRELPIIPELAAILERRRRGRTVMVNGVTQLCPLIFHRGNGKPVPQFERAWASATKAAGCSGKLLHDMRRFAARNVLHSGMSTMVCKKWTGHKSDKMFERYAILSTDDLRNAADAVRAYREKQVTREKSKVVSMQ